MKPGPQLQVHDRTSVGTQVPRALFGVLLLLALAVAVAAQQPAPTPAWDVTLKTNLVADSTLTVVNRCSKNHQFQVQLQNVPFLQFATTQVNVKGGATQLVPVKFDTRNLAPGVYQGTVWVICQTCKSEGACTQDREALQVVLRVTSDSPVAGSPNAADANPPSSPPTTGQPSANQPATPLEAETEGLRQIAEEKEAAARAAQERARSPEELAAEAEQKARELEAAAKRAEDLARPPAPGYGARVNGQQYEAGDIAQLEEMRKKNNDDLAAGRITPEEHQRRARELTAALAREERLANQARLKKEAEEAKAAAEKARADADKARAEADAAKKAADEAQQEADEARRKFEESARKLAEARRQEAEDKARAEAKAAADEAAAEQVRVATEERRKQEQREREKNLADNKYLLDNIKALGLIDSSPFKDVPGAFDAVINQIIPDILGKTAEGVVQEMIEGAADYTANSPIPISSIQALGGLYQVFAKRLDPCSTLGAPRIMDDLEKGKYTRKYSHEEAQAKVFRMCTLLHDLEDKLKKIKALHEQSAK